MKRIAIIVVTAVILTGCASLMRSATSKMADNISLAILNQNDLETVRLGAPAYLLMIDGLIEGDPENSDLLLAGSKLYSSYSFAFIAEEERAKRFADKSLAYARTALCVENSKLCEMLSAKQDQFQAALDKTDLGDVAALYGYGDALASWIQVNASDWNALADLPKLTALFEQSLKLDESFDNGGSHLYLGVLSSQLPPAFGGKPDKARFHFERALEIAGDKNLMIRVFMAQHYARLVFDQALHDSLLQEVLSKSADVPGFTLINTMAKQQATVLLEESVDFF
jgi:tetratricopeptide (TPR) repeat protein